MYRSATVHMEYSITSHRRRTKFAVNEQLNTAQERTALTTDNLALSPFYAAEFCNPVDPIDQYAE